MEYKKKMSLLLAVLFILLLLTSVTVLFQKTEIATLKEQLTNTEKVCNNIIDDANTCSDMLTNKTLQHIPYIGGE